MKCKPLALLLVCCSIPPQITAAQGSLSQAIQREAARVAAERPQVAPESDWSGVRNLAPGAEIVVTTQRMKGARRRFVSADDSGLTVLNLSRPSVSAPAAATIVEIAAEHASFFVAPGVGQSLGVKNVRVDAAGVFVDGVHVADLSDVVNRIPQSDVVEITGRHPSLMGKGLLIGLAAGAAPALVASLGCGGGGECAGYALMFAGLWGGVGAGIGLGIGAGIDASRHGAAYVIYRAP